MLKAILATIAFVMVWFAIEFLAVVIAPVVGPLLIIGLLAFLIYVLVRLVMSGR